MNLRRTIREMVAIMRDEDLAEVEVRRWFTTVRVRRPGLDAAVMANLLREGGDLPHNGLPRRRF